MNTQNVEEVEDELAVLDKNALDVAVAGALSCMR